MGAKGRGGEWLLILVFPTLAHELPVVHLLSLRTRQAYSFLLFSPLLTLVLNFLIFFSCQPSPNAPLPVTEWMLRMQELVQVSSPLRNLETRFPISSPQFGSGLELSNSVRDTTVLHIHACHKAASASLQVSFSQEESGTVRDTVGPQSVLVEWTVIWEKVLFLEEEANFPSCLLSPS